MKKYRVALEITNDVWVDADSPEDAESVAKSLNVFKMLDGAEYTVDKVIDEETGEEF